jgi:hypothetical protein
LLTLIFSPAPIARHAAIAIISFHFQLFMPPFSPLASLIFADISPRRQLISFTLSLRFSLIDVISFSTFSLAARLFHFHAFAITFFVSSLSADFSFMPPATLRRRFTPLNSFHARYYASFHCRFSLSLPAAAFDD